METKPNRITFTVQLEAKHDWHLVRKLLKALLRSYHLKCVRIQEEPSDQQPDTTFVENGKVTFATHYP